jgi:hypothetical protein
MLTQEMLSDFCANTNVLNGELSYLGGASSKSYNKLLQKLFHLVVLQKT